MGHWLWKTIPAAVLAANLAPKPASAPSARPGGSTKREPVTITVNISKSSYPRLNPDMWGVFFEDINFAADGGLHAELVKNRSFEFTDPIMGWKLTSDQPANTIEIRTEFPLNAANTHYLRIRSHGHCSISNEGFRGMGIRQGEPYEFRVFARKLAGTAAPTSMRIELLSPDGKSLGNAQVRSFDGSWTLKTARLTASATEAKAHLVLSPESEGTLDLDMVSLYPVNTWKKRPMGLRADLVQRLADLKPSFVRFPGGCIVEGRYLSTRYQWKKTIGPQEAREVLINRWNDEFRHKPAPDYFQSFGLGFMEYFQLCEDIGAQPLPVLNCGMACQFNSKELAPLDQLDPYVQDALDLIEFANGRITSEWGAKRAAFGHPKSFNLKYLGVGNEQWGLNYFPRYEQFARAIKKRYPDVQIVTSAGPAPAGKDFDLAWKMLWALGPELVDIVDEHCYAAPDWFFDNTHRYDGYDRKGPKVFMGEFAAQSAGIARPDNQNNWECALSEAAYMTGLERNGEVVRMSSYAPLLAHVDAWQWTPNLIWFDNLRTYATPNYYVQQMFMQNRGETILPASMTSVPLDEKGRPRLYVSATLSSQPRELILKVVNATGSEVAARLAPLQGHEIDPRKLEKMTVLAAGLTDTNSLDQPQRVAPKETRIRWTDQAGVLTLPPRSFAVIRIPIKPKST